MARNDIFETIVSCIREILPSVTNEQINAQASLKALGANSIDRVDILTGVMEALDINLNISELTEVITIGDMQDLFENKIKMLV